MFEFLNNIPKSGRSLAGRQCADTTRWAMFVASGAIPIQIIGEPCAPGASVTDKGYAMA